MKHLLALTLILFTICVFSQTTTVTLQPDASDGIDALILDDEPNSNFGSFAEFISFYWTRSGHQYEGKSLIKFDLSVIPNGSIITDAKLSFYWDQLGSAGQYGTNEAKLSRITSHWDENTVTWNTQPSISPTDFVKLLTSTSATQDYLDINVTSFISDMYSNPANNNGFLFEQINKSTFRSMKFASSDHTVPSKRPKLIVTYKKALACENQFTFQPDSAYGIDAVIYDDEPTKNLGDNPEFIAFNWTRLNHDYEGKSLLKFDLSQLPAGRQILSANLSLYWDVLSSAGQYGDNSTKLSRITSNWNESTVTWNNQPTVSSSDIIILPSSTSPNQNYEDIDVKSLILPMYSNQATNYGFMMEQVTKSKYRSMKFASSDHTVPSKRPKLVICLSSSNVVNPKDEYRSCKVFPNPTASKLIVYGVNDGVNYQLFDPIGREVLNGIYTSSINVDHLTAGVYFLHINNSICKIEIIR